MVKILESLKSLLMPPRKVQGLGEFITLMKKEERVVILTTKHCLFIADLLVYSLDKLNIKSEVILKKPKFGYCNLPHIVICPQVFKHLPVNYIAFQMEQSESSQWFTDEYFRKLNCAVAVFDYSLLNVCYLKKRLKNPDKVFYLPISINKPYIDKFCNEFLTRNYDIIFYGDDTSLRRKKILDILKSKYKVKIVNGIFGTALYEQLADAKIVVNIHYYENALLETTRLYECLSLNNNIIISERGRDQNQHKALERLVEFVDDGNVDDLINTIDFYMNDIEMIYKKISANKDILNNIVVTEFDCQLRNILKL